MGREVKQGEIVYNNKTDEVVVRRKRTSNLRTPFTAIGAVTNVKRRRKVVVEDIFDVLDKVSKGAFSVFNNLKYNRDEGNNVTKYVDEELTVHQKQNVSRKLRELKDVGLIRSVRKEIPGKHERIMYRFADSRNTFIINPAMLQCGDNDEAEYLWDKCKEGN